MIRMGLKRGISFHNLDESSMQVSIHAFHRVTLLHNNVHHDGFCYLRHRYPLPLGGDMDNTPLLQIGFDGHYVVYLWETGGEIPPVHPTRYMPMPLFYAISIPISINVFDFDLRKKS